MGRGIRVGVFDRQRERVLFGYMKEGKALQSNKNKTEKIEMRVIDQKEAKKQIEKEFFGHYDRSWSNDAIMDPIFPEGRTDVAIIQRDGENDTDGETKWYLIMARVQKLNKFLVQA